MGNKDNKKKVIYNGQSVYLIDLFRNKKVNIHDLPYSLIRKRFERWGEKEINRIFNTPRITEKRPRSTQKMATTRYFGKKRTIIELCLNPNINIYGLEIATVKARIKRHGRNWDKVFNRPLQKRPKPKLEFNQYERKIIPESIQAAMLNGSVEDFIRACDEHKAKTGSYRNPAIEEEL